MFFMARYLLLSMMSNISGYDPKYNFERTTHVRTAPLGLMGTLVQKVLDSLLPEWQDSVAISLLMERESLAAMIVAIVLLLFLIALRVSLRWYGEKYLHAYSVHVREQLRRAYQAFFNTAS
jgi:hypothetical protein